jgi:hypothetical protein
MARLVFILFAHFLHDVGSVLKSIGYFLSSIFLQNLQIRIWQKMCRTLG